jgi:hypothetical protein
MGVVGHQRSGKGSRSSINGVNLRGTNFDVTRRADDIDTTNYECNGEEQGTVGVVGTDVNYEAYWDSQENPIDSGQAPGIYPRDNLPNVILYLNLTDAIAWNAALCRVLSSNTSAPVRGIVGFKSTMKSNGGCLLPTGNA